MLTELRSLRDAGFHKEFLDNYAMYRLLYSKLPLSERCLYDFGYYLRMRYIEFLRKRI